MTHDAFVGAYAAAVSSERLPAPISARVVEVVRRDRSVAELRSEVESVRALAAAPPSRIVRRFVFLWFRVFVRETKHGKVERVNVKIPIPIPLVGALFSPGLSRAKALRAVALAESSDDPATAVSDYLDSVMAFEMVRVDERKSAENHSLVVVGFD